MTLPNTPVWTLAHLALKFPLAAGAAALGTAAYLQFAESPKPMVAITFDDGRQSIHDTALPIMQNRGMLGTVFITTGTLNGPSYMLETTLVDFVEAGWEIGAHSVSHSSMNEISDDDLFWELHTPIRELSMLSGQEILSFASPYGEFNYNVIDQVSLYYMNHVNAWSDQHGVTTVDNFNRFDIHRQDITAEISVEYVCDKITNLDDDSMYTMIFHDVTDVDGRYNTSVEKFEAVLDCVQDADVNVVRISDGIEAMERKTK